MSEPVPARVGRIALQIACLGLFTALALTWIVHIEHLRIDKCQRDVDDVALQVNQTLQYVDRTFVRRDERTPLP